LKKILVLLLALILFGCSSGTQKNNNKELIVIAGAESYDNASFNQFLMNEVQVRYTPTFIIVKDGKIVYYGDSVMSAEKFNNILVDIDQGTVKIEDDSEDKFREANIGREFMQKDFISEDGLTVLEIASTTCPYTRMQLVTYNPEIYEQHKDIQFVEYFLMNNQAEVDELFKSIESQ
jgi:hypothetical protein